MALNPYFTQGTKNEQNLVQDLINEQLRMYGVEIYYIPRKYMTTTKVIREVIESEFDDAYPIEAYVKSDVYEGAGILLSKFGVQQQDDITVIISRERWETYIEPLIENESNIKLATRPKGGDLIYFPLDDRLYEIKFVEYADPFYQLKDLYTYELRCEVFRYEDETIDTGIDAIDDSMEDVGYSETLSLLGIGTTATATATWVDGGLRFINLLEAGQGYTSTPTVAISSAPTSGIQATAVAITTSMTGFSTAASLDQVYLTNPGAGYTVPPIAVFVGGGGAGAASTVGIATTGGCGIVTVSGGGGGYVSAPTVTFSAPVTGINTATGVAVVSTGGTVSAIRIVNSGIGYTIAPTITISGPSGVGSGEYVYNELVVGSSSGVQARVKEWNTNTKQLKVSIATGTFTYGESITGQDSGAVYTLQKTDTDPASDTYARNEQIQTEADGILDFTQRNPFGDV